MTKRDKKYIGYGVVFKTRGQKYITIVPAENKDDAIDAFLRLDFDIQNIAHVRRVCIMQYPGPLSVKRMEENNWDKCFEIGKDKDTAKKKS